MSTRMTSSQSGEAGVPEVVIMRLPLYIRALHVLSRDALDVVSSHQLGEMLQVTPAQIRKDLSYFGRFGKQGRGYNVKHLLAGLRQIVGLDRHWNVVLVGVGRLGRAILSYPGMASEGFEIVAAFDSNRELIGETVGNLKVQAPDELGETVAALGITIGIIAVPVQLAQNVIDQLTDCGVRGILNYAPAPLQASNGVKVRSIDPVLSLQTMTYYLLKTSY